MSEKKAALIFKNYRIGETKLFLDVNSQRIEGETDISIKNETKNTGKDSYEIKLITTVVNKSKSMQIEVSMYGYFEVLEHLEDEKKETLIGINAPVIMFPYVRAYISALTGLSGLSPIIIPAIDFTKQKE